jgi:hypothetical protein
MAASIGRIKRAGQPTIGISAILVQITRHRPTSEFCQFGLQQNALAAQHQDALCAYYRAVLA